MVLGRKDLLKTFAPPNKLRKLNNRSTTMVNHSNLSSDADTSNVNVFVRVRPANEKEMSDNFRTVVKVVDEKLLVFDPQQEQEPFFFRGTRQKMRDIAKKQNKQLEFLFDGVFGPDVCNWDIHCKTTHNIIASVLDGYNCSVFVYGATGAGKTFTMLGKRHEIPGIMYHTMAELYQQISSISQEKKCHVGVSFVEVYNENVFDLLNPSGPLFLREDASGVTIVGLKVENISNADQLLEKLAQGNNNRTQHPTDSNAESSRSHAVFQVYVRMTAVADGQVKISKLSMIDLAGSERGMATGFKGMRFKEGSNINKSLLALGNCISSLADNLRHIPYRDSKLTRLLKDSLGGNCQTVMIANISPSSASYEDTYNTLKFASRAKKITTKLTKNIISSDISVSHYMNLVDKLETENTLLKSKVRALERTVTDSARAYSQMPDMSVWCNHLNELFDEKNKLCRRLLSVKSELHLLEWRINYKNSIRDIMEKKNSFQTPGYGMSINKIESSVKKFEGRLTALQTCIGDLNTQLKNNNEKLTKLFSEMEEARVLQNVKKDLDLKNALLRNTINEVSNKHLTRLLMLQQRRAESCERALKLKEPLLRDYHRLLSGLNMVTKSMTTEYENSVSVMEGIKTVSWCDTDPEEIDTASTNITSAMDLSFDNSLFIIDNYHQTLKLQPTVLPIMDMKEDENINRNNTVIGSEENCTIETMAEPIEEHNNLDNNCVNDDDDDNNNNESDDDDEDTANSTITLDAPSIPSLLSTATASDKPDISSLTPPTTSATQLTSSIKSSNLNETVTVRTDTTSCVSQTSGTNGQSLGVEKKEFNTTSHTAKKKPDFLALPVSSKKSNKIPMHRSNKENILDLKDITKNGIIDKSKTNGFKQTIVKTPAINRNQKHIDRLLLMKSALKSKSANVTYTSVAAPTPFLASQVPLTQSLKITHPKNRIKNHPYTRPETKSRVTDKKR